VRVLNQRLPPCGSGPCLICHRHPASHLSARWLVHVRTACAEPVPPVRETTWPCKPQIGGSTGWIATFRPSPITSGTLRELGYEPAAEASEFTLDGMTAAILMAEAESS